jgi:hypothetical protein
MAALLPFNGEDFRLSIFNVCAEGGGYEGLLEVSILFDVEHRSS